MQLTSGKPLALRLTKPGLQYTVLGLHHFKSAIQRAVITI